MKQDEQGEMLPQPHHDYVPAPTKRVRIDGRACVEMDSEKWLRLRQTVEFYARGKRL